MEESFAHKAFGKIMCWTFLSYVAVTFLILVPAFNWMYCVNHSYRAWMPNGILKATGHGIAWPVFIRDLMPGSGYHLKETVLCFEKVNTVIAGWTPGQLPSQEQLNQLDPILVEVLDKARRVDCAELNELVPEMGDHFEQEFVRGVERTRKSIPGRQLLGLMSGAKLIMRWGEWIQQNQESIEAKL